MRDFLIKASSIILLVCMILPLVACSDESADTDTTVTTAATTAAPVEDDPLAARRAIPDDLPEVNMDGYVMKVSSLEGFNEMFYAEEEVGEPVNDAFYYTRRNINERFNADMEVNDDGLDPYQNISNIKSLVSSGDTTYTLACGHSALLGPLTLNNHFLNINNLPHLNFDKPWWFDVEEYSFLDQCYFVPSDMSIVSLDEAWVLYANKNKMTDYGIEVPYQAVLDGKWTIDMLIGMTKDVYEDLNANNTDDGEDFYGLFTESNCHFWLESFGMDTLIKDGDTLHVDFDLDKMSAITEKLYGYFVDAKGVYLSQGGAGSLQEFSNGQSLFVHNYLRAAKNEIREIQGFDYAILPMPKWDEQQENYRTSTLSSPYCVMTTLPEENYEYTGILIEAFSAEGYKEVLPTYFELALKTKYATDNESMMMLDIINETKFSNFAWCYASDGYALILSEIIQGNSPDFVSKYERKYKVAAKGAEKIQEAFEKMAETNVW
ncbi:MAG: hypothetical protein IJA85_00580 [Clostridia bacterium]|nr:hypothetical protein [Clostridia bacterium]MBQ4573672.1 hypothetical protein [Clostridia bacterium]